MAVLNKKAQFTISALFSVFMIVVIFAALQPTLTGLISETAANLTGEGFGMAATVLQLLILGIVVAILGSIFVYARPYFAER